jgi:hypothetical protein
VCVYVWRTREGHRGKNVWRIAVDRSNSILVTLLSLKMFFFFVHSFVILIESYFVYYRPLFWIFLKASGGGDSAVRLWDIRSLLQSPSIGITKSYDLPPSLMSRDNKQKNEHIRCMKLLNHFTLCILTNRG